MFDERADGSPATAVVAAEEGALLADFWVVRDFLALAASNSDRSNGVPAAVSSVTCLSTCDSTSRSMRFSSSRIISTELTARMRPIMLPAANVIRIA